MKTHISLNVSDVRKSVEFYQRMFGIKPYKIRDDYAKFDVADPPLNLTMNQVKFEKGGSLSHMGVQVNSTEDVLVIARRWEEEGLITREEMQADCCYALQDKTWVTDPDGNEWEVFTVLEDTAGSKNAGSACCTPASEPVTIAGSGLSICC